MSIDRQTISRGPAIITYNGASFYSKGEITYGAQVEQYDIETDRFGPVDTRHADRRFEINFESIGQWTNLAVLFPYATAPIGSSVFGAVDTPLVIHTLAGETYTFHNAALTTMPTIRAGVKETLIGDITFTAILRNDMDPSDADAYYTVGSAPYPGDQGFNSCDIRTLAYASNWGAAPWDDFATEAGWEVSFDLALRDETVDGLGTVDMTFQSLKVSASCIPIGPLPTDVLDAQELQGNGNALGACRATTGRDLNIFADGVYIRLFNANLDNADLGQGTNRKVIGSSEWMSRRTVTGGFTDPLFFVGDTAPV